MPQVKQITTYKYDELSDAAKEKARAWFAQGALVHEWWDFIYDDAARCGLKITSFDLGRRRHAEGKLTMSAIDVAMKIKSEHGEACETYKTAMEFIGVHDEYHGVNGKITLAGDDSYDLEQEFEDHETEFLRSILDDFSIILQKEYEFQLSEEVIEEAIRAGDYDFLESGKIS